MKRSGRSPYINYRLIGEHIKGFRKNKRMTQAMLAESLGYKTETNYGKYERGDRPISLPLLADICVKLEVPLEDILEGTLIHEPWN